MPSPCNILDMETRERCQNERGRVKGIWWPFCVEHKDEWAKESGSKEDQGLGRINEHEWAALMQGPR